ncbi:hypothetical protein [Oryza sativa Japonica Group]|uniref:Os01g0945733 protein n=2 Tax=Oryza sativa subsp. japonica TaxID=39947 RepID=Q5JKI6_ORYSJ|nr:hypothetical protein [Oryza sativa Japonica Group]BAS76193.1 Os01g0945733 [Oryza sativa Japonica Group]
MDLNFQGSGTRYAILLPRWLSEMGECKLSASMDNYVGAKTSHTCLIWVHRAPTLYDHQGAEKCKANKKFLHVDGIIFIILKSKLYFALCKLHRVSLVFTWTQLLCGTAPAVGITDM